MRGGGIVSNKIQFYNPSDNRIAGNPIASSLSKNRRFVLSKNRRFVFKTTEPRFVQAFSLQTDGNFVVVLD